MIGPACADSMAWVFRHGVPKRGPKPVIRQATPTTKVSAALYHVAFPGLHVSVEEISTVEDTVVLRWTARTGPDKMAGELVASKPQSLTGITRSRFAGGKIVESWTEWDQVGVLRELGVPTD